MPEKETRISPAVIIPVGLGLGLATALGIFTLARAAPPGAQFKVSDLAISPPVVNPGQPVIISCLVTNIGAEAGDYTVSLGGDFVAEQEIFLQPGESKIVSFEVAPTVAGAYSVNVDGLTGTFEAAEIPVADIRVENLTISPSEVYIGETVTISVTATNYGTAAGSRNIICTVS